MTGGIPGSTFSLQTLFSRNLREQWQILYRLASGRRINSGSDDPAGMIAATRLESAITALEAESRAIQRTSSNVAIADGHLSQLSDMMSDLRGLVLAGANTGALSDDEVAANQLQIDSLAANIERFANDAISSLGGIRLSGDENQQLVEQLRSAAASVSTLGSGGANDLSSGNFEAAQSVIDEATSIFAEARGQIGAYQKYSLEARQESLSAELEGLMAAHSRIVDVDYAEEACNLARSRVQLEASARVLKIVNQNATTVLDLLS